MLSRLNTLDLDEPCWVWPDRDPVPIEADDVAGWLMRWGEDRASYVARRRAA